jgi:starch synthase
MAERSELSVLFVTSELYPFIKTGGLGDVSFSLPVALQGLGADIRILIPGYRSLLKQIRGKKRLAALPASAGSFPQARVIESRVPDTDVALWMIDCPPLYDLDGGPYQDAAGRDWPNNYLRFGLLGYAAAVLGSECSPLKWRPDIVHCNDWQAALAPAYLHFAAQAKAATVQTIHNLAFQGIFTQPTLQRLALPPESFNVNGAEYFGGISFLKAGLYYADRLTTVSPTYAREIQREPLGMGLQGLLATRRDDLVGILNGIDTSIWDPRTDPYLANHYDPQQPGQKAANKARLQQLMELEPRAERPLLGVVSRLTHQKGVDVLVASIPALMRLPAQLVLLGSGDGPNESALQALARTYSGQFAVRIGFDESVAHLITAGADLFLMPSRFEPCGLNQMYSQRYGTPPVVHATGGLVDSVTDCDAASLSDATATGFKFNDITAAGLVGAVERAVQQFHDQQAWRNIQRNGMLRDFSWEQSAKGYLDVYRELVEEKDEGATMKAQR